MLWWGFLSYSLTTDHFLTIIYSWNASTWDRALVDLIININCGYMADGSKSRFYVSKQNTKHTYIGTPPHALHADIIAYSRRNQIKKKNHTTVGFFTLKMHLARQRDNFGILYAAQPPRDRHIAIRGATHVHGARFAGTCLSPRPPGDTNIYTFSFRFSPRVWFALTYTRRNMHICIRQ